MQVSVVVAHRLSCCGSRALEHRLSSCGTWVKLLHGIWDLRTCLPCIGRRILNHCATGQVPSLSFMLEAFSNFWWCLAVHSHSGLKFLSTRGFMTRRLGGSWPFHKRPTHLCVFQSPPRKDKPGGQRPGCGSWMGVKGQKPYQIYSCPQFTPAFLSACFRVYSLSDSIYSENTLLVPCGNEEEGVWLSHEGAWWRCSLWRLLTIPIRRPHLTSACNKAWWFLLLTGPGCWEGWWLDSLWTSPLLGEVVHLLHSLLSSPVVVQDYKCLWGSSNTDLVSVSCCPCCLEWFCRKNQMVFTCCLEIKSPVYSNPLKHN